MEGKIDMAARRQVTNKLRDAYRKGSKADRGRILHYFVETTGIRSTARRLLSAPRLADPKNRIDKRSAKPRLYGDDARLLLEERTEHIARQIALTPTDLVTLTKRSINRKFEVMGFRTGIALSVDVHAVASFSRAGALFATRSSDRHRGRRVRRTSRARRAEGGHGVARGHLR